MAALPWKRRRLRLSESEPEAGGAEASGVAPRPGVDAGDPAEEILYAAPAVEGGPDVLLMLPRRAGPPRPLARRLWRPLKKKKENGQQVEGPLLYTLRRSSPLQEHLGRHVRGALLLLQGGKQGSKQARRQASRAASKHGSKQARQQGGSWAKLPMVFTLVPGACWPRPWSCLAYILAVPGPRSQWSSP